MDIIDAIQPTKRRLPVDRSLIDHDHDAFGDLDAQQRHREALLREAVSFVDRVAQAGCVSEISIVENIFNRDEYQEVIQEISDFLGSSSAMVYAPTRPSQNVKVECYDDNCNGDSWAFEFAPYMLSIDDDDIETLGYMGWLAR